MTTKAQAQAKALPPIERRLFGYAHAAAYLGISERAMKDLGGPNGQILQVKIGHRTLFDREDLDAYIERIKRQA